MKKNLKTTMGTQGMAPGCCDERGAREGMVGGKGASPQKRHPLGSVRNTWLGNWLFP